MTTHLKKILQAFSFRFLLFAFSILLFFLAFPNSISLKGFPFCAWLLLIPLCFLMDSLPLAVSPFIGFAWAYIAWNVYAYWLNDFHPMAGFVGAFVKAVPMAIVFVFFQLSRYAGKRYLWALRLSIWVLWEYIGSIGYLGFPYGALAYTQWRVLPLLQLSSLGGNWLISAVLVFPAIFFASFLSPSTTEGKPKRLKAFSDIDWPKFFRWGGHQVSFIVFAAFLALAIPLSYRSLSALEKKGTLSVLLIQPNSDPWKGGLQEYRREFDTLISLSEAGLRAHPETELVVWPETAFVPRIYWHHTFREDRDYFNLITKLLNYLEGKRGPDGDYLPFIIGNHDARPVFTLDGERDQKDYNAAILFKGQKDVATYRKRHLVPFTEHFPYRKQFPRIYQALLEADTHFWDKGDEWTMLPVGPYSAAAPICYEDAFAYITRDFARAGADFFTVMSNDAWAHSRVSQVQHASMAVFRAVETRRPVLRATASGETMYIGPSGKVLAEAPSMERAWLALDMDLYTGGETLYLKWGNFIPYLALLAFFLLSLLAVLRYTLKRKLEK